jgi:hypothetical protein
MISIQTPAGKKGLILRGIMTPSGNKAITSGKITTADGDLQFWDGSVGSLTVSASPPSANGGVAFGSATPITTNVVTASATGGSAPYSYAWAKESGDVGWTVNSPSSAATSFKAASVSPGAGTTATMRCTVTDARGATGTVDVSVAAYNYGGLGSF